MHIVRSDICNFCRSLPRWIHRDCVCVSHCLMQFANENCTLLCALDCQSFHFYVLCKQSICTPSITVLTIVWRKHSFTVHHTDSNFSHRTVWTCLRALLALLSQVGFHSSFAVYSLRIFLYIFFLLFIRFAPTALTTHQSRRISHDWV